MSRQRMLRTSERSQFKWCPQAWWWRWREGLVSKGPPSDALWFGTGWHLVMAHWYCGPGLKRGADPIKVWREWVKKEVRFIRTVPFLGAEYKEEVYVEAGELGERMLENYFNTYGDDADIHMIAPEQPFQVQVNRPFYEDLILYLGTFDGAYRNGRDEPWLLEHKTAKQIMTSHLDLDDQGGSYWAVATTALRSQGLIGPREELKGITYNFARKAKPDTRPRNADGKVTNKPKKEHYIAALGDKVDPKCSLVQLEEMAKEAKLVVLGDVSATQPAPYFKRESVFRVPKERNTQIRRIGEEAALMESVRDGTVPLIKSPSQRCQFCDFKLLCKMHEIDPRDAEEYKSLAFRVEDPYKDHRKSAHVAD